LTVVALAGHVDHGKTALVRSLTGIETDRLREEKERGMTTDLGFASLVVCGPDGRGRTELGIIDVPGHERYIRNMAGGAWGADLVLLVVAADDGWMAQTETHARVLAALGTPRVIVVLTKTDKCENSQVEMNGEDALARAALIFGAAAVAPRWFPVSNRSGEGLPALLEGLAREAALLEDARARAVAQATGGAAARGPTQSTGSVPGAIGREAPLLFIDRVFSKSGAGLVVCGTLRGAQIRVGDELDLFPAQVKVRVRGLEALGEKSETAQPHERVALNITRPSALPRRGDLLTGSGTLGRDILMGTEFLARLEMVPTSFLQNVEDEHLNSRVLASGGEAELSLGSAYSIVRIHPLGKGGFFRVLCDENLPVPRQLPAVLLRHGGAEVLGRLRFLRSGKTDKKSRHTLLAALAGLETLSLDPPLVLASLILETRLAGFLELSAVGPLADATAFTSLSTVPSLLRERGIERRGDWLLNATFLARVLARSREIAVDLPGKPDLVSAALVSAFTLPRNLADMLTREGLGLNSGSMTEAGSQHAVGSAQNLNQAHPPALDKATKAAEKSLRLAGSTGFEGTSKEIDRLCALKLAIPLDRTLFIHVEVYQQLVAKTLAGKKENDRVDIAEAKTRTGYSRKYILPFLNRLERDGWVKRDGDARVVLRLPQSAD
jgi:selenocysteine-specific elongation factor